MPEADFQTWYNERDRSQAAPLLQSPGVATGDFESWYRNAERSRRTDFIMRQGLAADRNRAERTVRLYERTGLDLGLLTTHLDEIEQQVQMAGFDVARFRRESPLVAAWAQQSPQHAAVTWADADALTDLESTLTPDLSGAFSDNMRQELMRQARVAGITLDTAPDAKSRQQRELGRVAMLTGHLRQLDRELALHHDLSGPLNLTPPTQISPRVAVVPEGDRSAWEAATTDLDRIAPFVGGISEAQRAWAVYQAVQRVDAGTHTTQDLVRLLEYDNELRRNSTFAADVMDLLVQLPAFGAEMYMTGGIYTAGKEAGKKAGFKATKAALRGMLSRRMTGLLARGAGVVLGGSFQGSVALAHRTVADTIRRMTPDLAALEQDDGTIELMTMPGSEDGFGEALAKAAAGSAIEGITEHTGAALIGKPLAAIAKRIPMADKLTAMRAMVMSRWLRQNPGSTVRQFAARVAKQTGWDGVIEEIGEEEIGKVLRRIAQVDAQYEFTTPEEFLQQAIAFSVVPGAVGTLDAAFYSKEAASKAQQQTAFFQAIGDSVKRSQMLATMPEGLQNIVAGITKNGDVETLYQDVQAWNDHWGAQNIDPRAKYIELTGDAAAYDQAAQAGHDLPIPTAAYAVHIAPTDDAKAINRDLRLGPDQPTVRELEQIAAQLDQQARQAEQQAQAEAGATGDASATSGNTSGGVRQDVYNQLLATGASAEAASQQADLWEAFFGAMAERTGADPSELYNRYGVRIVRDLPDVLTKISRTDLLDVMLDRLRSGDVPTFETARGLGQASIERRLLDWARQNGLPDATESISDPELREMAQSDRVLAFGGKIPTELRTHFEGRPNVLGLLRSGDSLGRGSDFLADVGFDRYVQMVEELAGGQTAMVEQARELARNAPDPEAQLLAWLLERTPRAEARTSKVMLQTNTLRAGDSFTFEGHAVQVVEDIVGSEGAGGATIQQDLTVDQADQPAPGLLLVGDELSVPVWAIEEIPADDGSIERETPAPAPGSATGSAPGGSASGAGIAGGGGMAELQALRTVLNQLGVDVGTMDNAAIRELLQQQMQAQPAQGQTLGQDERPVGPHGPIFTEYRHNATAAIAKLHELQAGEAIAALHHPEAGDIDLIWGSEGAKRQQGFGVAKLFKWHPEVLDDLQGYLAAMVKVAENDNTIQLESPTHHATIRRNWKGDPKVWLLTAFHKRGSQSTERTVDVPGGPKGLAGRQAPLPDGEPRNTIDQARGEVKQNDGQTLDQPLVIGGARARTSGGAAGRKRGAITFSPDGQITISLFQKADMSTFLHESGHAFLRIMADLAAHPNATEQLRGDWQAVLKWLGAKPGASVQDLTVEQHEQWARGFEAYLFEGKAPNPTLRRAFYRFRQWLLRIYRSISRLGVELTDDIRQVMDRLVAADAEIEAARRETGAGDLFVTQQDALDAGMTVEGYQAYTELAEQAKQQADDQLVQQLMGELTRQRADWWRGEQEATRKEVEAELDQQPIFRALAALQRNRMPDGSRLPEGVRPMKLDAKVLVAQHGKDILKKLPRPYVYTWEGGMHPDEVAELVGFGSGEELVDNLLRARNRKQLIEAEVERLMRERYGDMVMDGSIADKAIEAWHQDRRGELLMHELRTLAGRVRRRTPSLGTLAEQARQQIAGKRARDIRPVLYLRAEAKAAQEAFAALTARDWEAAYRAKSRQILNHALYIAARDAKQEVDAMVRDMARYRKPRTRARLGKVGGNYLQAIDEIMARTEFVRVTQSELDRRLGLREWIAEREAAGDTLGEVMRLPAGLADEARRTNYQERTLAELRDIKQLVDQIEHQAEVKDILLANLEKTQKEDAREGMIGALEANGRLLPPRPLSDAGMARRQKLSKTARRFDASLLKPEQLFDWWDNYQVDGPWHQYIWNPLAKAQAEELTLSQQYATRLAAAFEALPREVRSRFQERVSIPGLTMTTAQGDQLPMVRQDLIAIALNAGNESNYAVMKGGMGWSDQAIAEGLSRLTKAEWDFVQEVWNTLESLRPAVFEHHKKFTGLEPERVEPRPIQTPFGTYAGGYYPLFADPESTSHGSKQEAAALGLMDSGYTRANTFKGHTKERTGAIYRIDFNLYRLPAHTAAVIHDLTHRGWVIDANWMLTDPDIKDAINRHAGPEYYGMLQDMVRRVANDRNVASIQSLEVVNKLLRYTRKAVLVRALGFRVSSMLVQVADFPRIADVIGEGNTLQGFRWLSRGLAQWWRSPRGAYQFVLQSSGEMQHRFETMDRDLRDMAREFSGRSELWPQIQEFSLRGMAVFERLTAVPAWLGAYQRAVEDGLSHELAVQAGDRAVRLGLGAGGAKDLTVVQSPSNELTKLLTMFYTPGAALYSRLRDVARQTRSGRDVPKALLRLFFIWPLTLTVTMAIKGQLGPDDEDEDWTIWYLRQLAAEPMGAVPIVRDVAGSVTSGRPYSFTPAERFFDDMTRAARLTWNAGSNTLTGEMEDEDLQRLIWSSYQAASTIAGAPTGQLEITGGYLLDLLQGEDEPEDLGDFLHDLAYPRPRRKEKD